MKHPVTGRFMAGDCERDCLEHCAGLCGVAMSDGLTPDPSRVSNGPMPAATAANAKENA